MAGQRLFSVDNRLNTLQLVLCQLVFDFAFLTFPESDDAQH